MAKKKTHRYTRLSRWPGDWILRAEDEDLWVALKKLKRAFMKVDIEASGLQGWRGKVAAARRLKKLGLLSFNGAQWRCNGTAKNLRFTGLVAHGLVTENEIKEKQLVLSRSALRALIYRKHKLKETYGFYSDTDVSVIQALRMQDPYYRRVAGEVPPHWLLSILECLMIHKAPKTEYEPSNHRRYARSPFVGSLSFKVNAVKQAIKAVKSKPADRLAQKEKEMVVAWLRERDHLFIVWLYFRGSSFIRQREARKRRDNWDLAYEEEPAVFWDGFLKNEDRDAWFLRVDGKALLEAPMRGKPELNEIAMDVAMMRLKW